MAWVCCADGSWVCGGGEMTFWLMYCRAGRDGTAVPAGGRGERGERSGRQRRQRQAQQRAACPGSSPAVLASGPCSPSRAPG